MKLVPQGPIISLRHHKLTLRYDHSCLQYLQFVAASDRHVIGKVDMSDSGSVVLRSSPLSIIDNPSHRKWQGRTNQLVVEEPKYLTSTKHVAENDESGIALSIMTMFDHR